VDRSPARIDGCASYDLLSRQPKDSFGTGVTRSNVTVVVKAYDAILHRSDHGSVALLAFP
jgi:hypothetical protein